MTGCQTRIHKFQAHSDFSSSYRFGVSLHSHTMHSKEYLDRLPTYIAKVPIGSYILEREIGRSHLYTGRIFDFKKIYWTPPLSPREAYDLEKTQIKMKLGIRAMVSLTDHDNIEAGLHLRILERTAKTPVSVEWSVPFEQTEFHLGVHNLPPAQAREWMERLAGYTAHPEPAFLPELMASLSAEPSVLVVLNHPFWDAKSIGKVEHRVSLKAFLHEYRGGIHALELNGMRSRRENREVLTLAEEVDVPVISGGDRHGCEPNATLNVTRAGTFEEFVQEIREERKSEVVLMPQFFEPLQLRLLENAWHALADAPGEFGRRHWMTRVFIEENGAVKPLSHYTGTRFHRVIDKFRWVMALVTNPVLRPALRLPFLGNEEGGL
ncbi:MAG TPA: hypothetical protein VGI13_03695 [Candidatus Acidoferrum sp.]